MHFAGQGGLRCGSVLLLALAEGHGGFLRLVQGNFGHALEGGVGCAQHGLAGHRCAGKGVKTAAVHRVETLELILEFRLARAAAQGLGFLKVGVAHHAGIHHTVCVNAQRHGHAVGIAGLGGLHAVAHQVAVCVQRFVEAVHTGLGIAFVQRNLLITVRRHHRAEGFLQRGHLVFLDGAAGEHVGCGQHHRGNQRDDAQRQVGRKLLFLGRIVLHAFPSIGEVFPVCSVKLSTPRCCAASPLFHRLQRIVLRKGGCGRQLFVLIDEQAVQSVILQ